MERRFFPRPLLEMSRMPILLMFGTQVSFFLGAIVCFSFLVEQKRILKQMKLKTWPFSSGDGTKDFFLTVTKNHKSERGVGK